MSNKLSFLLPIGLVFGIVMLVLAFPTDAFYSDFIQYILFIIVLGALMVVFNFLLKYLD